MKTYFGYIRVSTPRQGERGVSLQEQKDAILRYAERNGLQVAQWFEEQQTAAKRGRPVWNGMLKLLRRGRADGVMIHKIDRSARNLKDWADLGDMIDEGVEVHFVNESLDLNSRGGRLSADIQAVVAADYIRNLREEARKGIRGRLKQGLYPMRAPVGYLDRGAGKPKAVDPVKGPLVRTAFELYASGKYPILQLVEEMYRRGLRNLAGGKVTRNGMSTILNNLFYVGVIRVRATGETYAGNHEALISKALFDDVQAVRDGRLNTRKKKYEFLFRRFVRCERCGYALIGELQKGHVYYRCHTDSCPTLSIREEIVSEFVTDSLSALEFSPEETTYLRSATERLKRGWIEEREKVSAALTMNLTQTRERLARLTDAYLDQSIEKDLFEERKTTLLMERRSIEEQIANLNTDPEGVPEKLRKFLELAGSLKTLYSRANPEQKRSLLKITTSNLKANEKTLIFPYASPFQAIASRNTASDGRPSKGLARTCEALIASLLPNAEICWSALSALESADGKRLQCASGGTL